MAQTDYAGAVWSPSPNFGYQSTGQHGRPCPITAIVVHGTAGGGAVSWFSQAASQVSAHYVVDTNGSVTQCVREGDVAWHAGEVTTNSSYYGQAPNTFTIGIEHDRTPSYGASTSASAGARRGRPTPIATRTRDEMDADSSLADVIEGTGTLDDSVVDLCQDPVGRQAYITATGRKGILPPAGVCAHLIQHERIKRWGRILHRWHCARCGWTTSKPPRFWGRPWPID